MPLNLPARHGNTFLTHCLQHQVSCWAHWSCGGSNFLRQPWGGERATRNPPPHWGLHGEPEVLHKYWHCCVVLCSKPFFCCLVVVVWASCVTWQQTAKLYHTDHCKGYGSGILVISCTDCSPDVKQVKISHRSIILWSGNTQFYTTET